MNLQLITTFMFSSCFLNVFADALLENSPCTNSGNPGTCKIVTKCYAAIRQIIMSQQHDYLRCDFKGIYEIVCCPNNATTKTTAPTTTTPFTTNAPQTKTTTNPILIKGPVYPSETACKSYSSLFSVPAVFNIIDGEDAALGEFPHMVALGLYNIMEDRYYFSCGGTIISERYVLTAAHCMNNAQGLKLVFVRAGVLKVPESVQSLDTSIDIYVDKVIVHPEHHIRKKHNDLALAKLARPLTWTANIKPACLYSKNNNPQLFYITGWGQDASRKKKQILQKATVHYTTQDNCNQSYAGQIRSTQICANDSKSDTCLGDSGGPLQIFEKNKSIFTVVGITSYGKGCATRYPGVYTRVSSYVSWIENIVW